MSKTDTTDATSTTIGLGIVLITFFLTPYIPVGILRMIDLFIVRLVILGIFFLLAMKNPFLALVYFLVVAALFTERNKTKLRMLQASMTGTPGPLTPTVPSAIQEIVTPPTAPPQPDFLAPSESSIPFSPQDDAGENIFSPVSATINTKRVLPTETVSGSNKAIQQLFSWVNPALVQGDA